MLDILYKSYVPVVVFGLLLFLSFLIIKPLLIALLMGALLAYIFFGVYTFFVKKIKSQTVSALVVCTFVLLLLLIPSVFLVKSMVEESYVLFTEAKQMLSGGVWEECSAPLCKTLQNMVHDPKVNYYLQLFLKSATTMILDKGSAFLMSVPMLIVSLFVIFFTMFYFLIGGEDFLAQLNAYLSMHEKKYAKVLLRLREIVKGVVFGYGIVALMQGALGAIGFFLFGVPSALFWGVIMMFLALIPFLGTGFVWIPAAGYIFFQGMLQNSTLLMVKGLGLAVYCFIFVATLDNFIRPKLISEKANIHPVIVMIGILGGLMFFGPIGVIVGPLVLCLTTVFIEMYLVEKI